MTALVIRTLEELEAKITECNDALAHQSDDAMRALFNTFELDFSAEAPADPFSAEYRAFQFALYERVAGQPYAVRNERTLFLVENYIDRPFPYYLKSPVTAGNHLLAIGFMLRTLQVPPGGRILEFGPGWGNTTIALAQLGYAVTAVDIEPNFCEVIRRRAVQHRVEIEVVEGDFFWAEQVTAPFDAVLFFECFHHCDDHMRLLRALRVAVRPGGAIYFASEPILPAYGVPWGVRTDGEALWAMRNFHWLELGFRESYFHAALARTGWAAQKHRCLDPDYASVWVAHRVEPDLAAAERLPPGEVVSAEDRLSQEIAAVYRSTSWRVTAPLRAVRRLLG